MKPRNIDALEKCIELMEAGVPVEDCIKQYPDVTPEFRGILETTKNIMNLREEQVPDEGMNRNRIKLLSQAKAQVLSDEQSKSGFEFNRLISRIRQTMFGLFSSILLFWRIVLVVVITGVLIVFSRGLVITSAKSLPGDSLYPIKRAVEDISLFLVHNREVKQEYENKYNKQRVEEVNRLIELKRIQKISFEGILESQSDSNWMVSGISVMLQADTTLVSGAEKVGSFKVGSVVEVEGITNSAGGVFANEIHLREYQFYGTVQKIDSNLWQISGIQLIITFKTQIDDDIRVGDNVAVLTRSEDNGLYALAILREQQPVETPNIQQSPESTPTVFEDPIGVNIDEHKIVGTLEKISDSYWVVNGQIVYLVGFHDIPLEIKLGDTISISYRIEGNGSYSALGIEKIVDESPLGVNEPQGTPEVGKESEAKEASVSYLPSNDELKGRTVTPENHGTPEPTGEPREKP
jgi:hypothetical protein